MHYYELIRMDDLQAKKYDFIQLWDSNIDLLRPRNWSEEGKYDMILNCVGLNIVERWCEDWIIKRLI